MAKDNTLFLKFSAYSIKDLITRKLSEDSKFTDQVYEGSNLAILIDIISYMYQCLIYLLNNAASESMFADTLLYENITRLVKFIGYQPKGCSPSTLPVYITNITGKDLRSYWIPPYSRIDTGLTDSNGNKIYFSTASNDIDGDSIGGSAIQLDENTTKEITLYNGEWKLYNTVFTASGTENEVFVLDGLRSDSSTNEYVAHDFIDVYVMPYDYNVRDGSIEQWQMDKNGIFTGYLTEGNHDLFNNLTVFKSLYPGTYPIYSAYLNENKTYEIRFGNGIVGKKLNPGDRIYVFYLDTNGPDGKIDINDVDVDTLKFLHSASMFGISDTLFRDIFRINPSDGKSPMTNLVEENNITTDENSAYYKITFTTGTSTSASTEETVDEIRAIAPKWFTTGNRLVTRYDYEYYLKNARNANSLIGCSIIDVKCMNNWEYIASFYKWLYELGTNGRYVQYASEIENPIVDVKPDIRKYLKRSNFIRYNYFYADSADANNLYMWIKSTNDLFNVQNTTKRLNKVLSPIKLMTAELIACKAINVNFAICAAPIEYVLNNYIDVEENDTKTFDENNESYIEITIDDNTLYVASSILKEICNILLEGFNINTGNLGQCVKYDQMLDKIYNINGVLKIRTVFVPSKEDGSVHMRAYDGLSFATWSNSNGLIQLGDDMSIGNSVRHIEDFLFPVLYNNSSNILSRIKIIKKTLTKVNTIKF